MVRALPARPALPAACGRQASRSATIGSTRLARIAGSHTAASATSASTIGTETNTAGSHAFTPNSRLATSRARPNAEAEPDHHSDRGQANALQHHHVADLRSVRAERQADADFLRALGHRVRHQTVDPDRCERERRAAEHRHERHVEPLPRNRPRHDVVHRPHVGHRQPRHLPQLLLNGIAQRIRLDACANDPRGRGNPQVQRVELVGDLPVGDIHARAGIVVEASVAQIGDDADDLLKVTSAKDHAFPRNAHSWREADVEARDGGKLVATFHLVEVGTTDNADASFQMYAAHWIKLMSDNDAIAAANAGKLASPKPLKDYVAPDKSKSEDRKAAVEELQSTAKALFDDIDGLAGSVVDSQALRPMTME